MCQIWLAVNDKKTGSGKWRLSSDLKSNQVKECKSRQFWHASTPCICQSCSRRLSGCSCQREIHHCLEDLIMQEYLGKGYLSESITKNMMTEHDTTNKISTGGNSRYRRTGLMMHSWTFHLFNHVWKVANLSCLYSMHLHVAQYTREGVVKSKYKVKAEDL